MYAHLTTRCTSLDASANVRGRRRHGVDAEIEGVLIRVHRAWVERRENYWNKTAADRKA
jgi:hypothetical protein